MADPAPRPMVELREDCPYWDRGSECDYEQSAQEWKRLAMGTLARWGGRPRIAELRCGGRTACGECPNIGGVVMGSRRWPHKWVVVRSTLPHEEDRQTKGGIGGQGERVMRMDTKESTASAVITEVA